MNKNHANPKNFEEKASVNLNEAKSKIEATEASAKGKLAQAEGDAVKGLKKQRKTIDKKTKGIRAAGEADAARVKSEIQAGISEVKDSLQKVGAEL